MSASANDDGRDADIFCATQTKTSTPPAKREGKILRPPKRKIVTFSERSKKQKTTETVGSTTDSIKRPAKLESVANPSRVVSTHTPSTQDAAAVGATSVGSRNMLSHPGEASSSSKRVGPRASQRSTSSNKSAQGSNRLKTPKRARMKIKKSWNEPSWSTIDLNHDSGECEAHAKKSLLREDGTTRKPIFDWARSFIVRAFGARRVSPESGESQGVDPSWLEENEQHDSDGVLSGDRDINMEIAQSAGLDDATLASHNSGSELSLPYSDFDVSMADDRTNGILSQRRHVSQAMSDTEVATSELEDRDEENDATDSDGSQRNNSDVEISQLPDDGIPLDAPFKLVDDDALRPMLLYDVRVALPKTIRNQGRRLLRTIDKDMRALNSQQDIDWIETFSLPQWHAKPLADIEASMQLGRVMIIRDTRLNFGWAFDMESATRFRSGASPVQVQDFANRHRPTGIIHDWVPLADVVHPDHRDPDKVYNLLDAPQRNTVVPIPRQSDLDYGTKALRAREAALADVAGLSDRDLDSEIQKGLNWAIISQKHSLSLGHVDTAGVYTAIVILAGVKYWAIRKTALEGRTEIDVDDAEYFVDLNERDLNSLPGNATDWVAVLLFPGDVLIIPPNARHLVFTVTDAIMSGIHFYNHTNLQRSLCGWICSKFTTTQISNAEHDNFLSIIQAFATFWLPGFVPTLRRELAPDDPVLRSHPYPNDSAIGLPGLISVGVSLVFNDTLSGVKSPSRGLYFEADLAAFKQTWKIAAEEGRLEVMEANYVLESYRATIQPLLKRGDSWDNRWTCAGFGPLLIHLARAVVYLSVLWEDNRVKPQHPKGCSPAQVKRFKAQERENNWLRPDRIRDRAIDDISLALGIDRDVVGLLVGSMSDCERLQNTKLFPEVAWIPGNQSARPASLWDALCKQ